MLALSGLTTNEAPGASSFTSFSSSAALPGGVDHLRAAGKHGLGALPSRAEGAAAQASGGPSASHRRLNTPQDLHASMAMSVADTTTVAGGGAAAGFAAFFLATPPLAFVAAATLRLGAIGSGAGASVEAQTRRCGSKRAAGE